jgi:hypothetical protein
MPSWLHDFLFGQLATASYGAHSLKTAARPWIQRPRLATVVTSQNTHGISLSVSGLPVNGKGPDRP